jgi:hypothetical protein
MATIFGWPYRTGRALSLALYKTADFEKQAHSFFVRFMTLVRYSMSSLLNNRTQEEVWNATRYFLDIATTVVDKLKE